jgi:hypothetical protein
MTLDDFKNAIAKMFPKPNIPQKRYIILVIGLYYILKMYTLATPNPADDIILEEAKNFFVSLQQNTEEAQK